MSPDDPRHGTFAGRPAHRKAGELPCDACKDANARYQRHYRKIRGLYGDRNTSTVGLVRRVQALMCLGWSMAQIADRIGMDQKQLWVTTQQSVVRLRTAARVAAVFEEMSMTFPPQDTKSQRISVAKTLAHARRNAYLPPLAWDDIDDPAEQPSTGPDDDASHLDPVVLDRIIAGDYALLDDVRHIEGPTVRREVCRRWWQSGRTLSDLERRTGWRADRYFKIAEEAVSA